MKNVKYQSNSGKVDFIKNRGNAIRFFFLFLFFLTLDIKAEVVLTDDFSSTKTVSGVLVPDKPANSKDSWISVGFGRGPTVVWEKNNFISALLYLAKKESSTTLGASSGNNQVKLNRSLRSNYNTELPQIVTLTLDLENGNIEVKSDEGSAVGALDLESTHQVPLASVAKPVLYLNIQFFDSPSSAYVSNLSVSYE